MMVVQDTLFKLFGLMITFHALTKTTGETVEVRQSLLQFITKLSPSNNTLRGWRTSSDPCIGLWQGVWCNNVVFGIVLDDLNLSGVLDAKSLCVAKSLAIVSLRYNNINGNLPADLLECTNLTHLYLSGNNLSREIPTSLTHLGLRRFDVSQNKLSGIIPDFNFTNLSWFNVSYNDLMGQIPYGGWSFNATSFEGNPGLCGKPLSNLCNSAPSPAPDSSLTRPQLGALDHGLVLVIFLFIPFLKQNI